MTEAIVKNPLKGWIRRSRKEEQRAPERYLSYYSGKLVCDETYVRMTRATYEEIIQNCGRYDGTTPTGKYCGKMFIRGYHLVWFGIDKDRPMEYIRWNSRMILIRPTIGQGPARRLNNG